MTRWLAAVFFALLGCRDHSHGHDDEAEHGHGHGEGSIEITQWGEHSELFAEYAPLVVGQASETAIHATALADFTPLTRGTVDVELVQADGSKVSVTADKVARPGIFTPELTATKAGPCKLTIVIRVEGWTDRFEAQTCEVNTKAPTAEEHSDDSAIAFSKEQQWVTEFATTVVARRSLHATVRVSAEIRPVSGREAHLTAALAGRVRFGSTAPVLGMTVKKGQLLATVSPPLQGATNRASIDADVVAARAELEAASADKQRVERLAKEEAVSGRRVKEATAREAIARSRLRAASERLREYDASASGRGRSGNAFRVRSPIDGTLVTVDVTSGETVQGGHHLFTVIDMSRIWLVGQVFEPDIPAVIAAHDASFKVEGYDEPFVIDEKNSKLVTVGRVIDPSTRTVPIVFEMTNTDDRLRIGQFADLEIATGTSKETLAVPASAVLTDGGRSIVFVQVSGEAFERRVVKTGLESKSWVSIESGVQGGERVVSTGAHIIKLASAASSAPAHGHAH